MKGLDSPQNLGLGSVCPQVYNHPWDSLFHFWENLEKPGKVAVIAAMRKLVCLLNRMITNPNIPPNSR